MDLSTTTGYVAGFPLEMSLRDLGGQRGADGRTVRHGLLFRGAALTDLTEEQKARVDELGLRLVFDLRAQTEARGRDDYVPEGAAYVRIAGMYDKEGVEVDFSPESIMRIEKQVGDPSLLMSELYGDMARGNPAVRELVARFCAGDAPLYFHCTAGKDRTGVCAALLLSILGVSDEDIVDEFLLTNVYRSSIINNPPEVLPPWLPSFDGEAWRKANGVDAASLKAMFMAADEGCDTREEYFLQEFGLDEDGLRELRDRYLE